MRIITFSTDIADIFHYLDLTSYLVGISKELSQRDAFKKIPAVLTSGKINAKKMSSLKPDLVILSGKTDEKILHFLQENFIPFLQLFPNSIMDIPNNMVTIGRLLGEEEKVIEKARFWLEEFKQLQYQGAREINKLSAYIEEKNNPVQVGNRITGELLEFCGFEVLFEEQVSNPNEEDRKLTDDELRNTPFDVVFWAWLGEKDHLSTEIEKRNNAHDLLKWNDGNTFVIQHDLIFNYGPHLLDGLKELLRLRAIAEAKGVVVNNLDTSF